MRRIILALSFLLLVLASSSHAAGRVFYDGWESGNTNLWSQADGRNLCTVVASSTDGVAGPYAGTKMARCNWNGTVAWSDVAAVEILGINSISYTNEVFFRLHFRRDNNLEMDTNSGTKVFRWANSSGPQVDLWSEFKGGPGLFEGGVLWGQEIITYWGGNDTAASSTSWHKAEYYFNHTTGAHKVWHDSILTRNDVTTPAATRLYPFYITSNWADPHDAVNHVYFDEVEIYSDTGTGATGLMSDASISGGGGGGPPAPTIPNPPFNLKACDPPGPCP